MAETTSVQCIITTTFKQSVKSIFKTAGLYSVLG